MSNWIPRMILSFVTALSLVLTACAPTTAPEAPTAKPVSETAPAAEATSPAATPKPAAEDARYGGVLPVALYAEPPSLDLHQHQMLAARMAAVPAYDTLLEYNPLKQSEIISDLAERYEVSKDGLTYTFYLNKDAKFHDGSPLTADDVRYNLDRLRDPPKGVLSPRKSLLASIDRVETPDANTVKVVTKYPDASFIGGIAISHHVIYPKKVVEEKGDMKRTAIGTGPFKFVSYESGVLVQYTKNREYFRKGRPYLDGLTFYIITDPATLFAAFRTGRVWLTSQGSGGLNPVQSEITKRELKGKATALSYVVMNNIFVFINVTRKPLDDVRVRRALHLLTDRNAVINVAWGGDGVVSLFFLPEPYGEWDFPNAEVMKMPGYRPDKTADIEEAKKLLADAGYAKGLSLGMISMPHATHARTMEVLRDNYKAAGIDLKVEPLGLAIWSERKAREAYDLLLNTGGVHADDPTAWFELILSAGISFKDQQLDLWREEQARILDFDERKKLLQKMELRLLELLPVVPSLLSGLNTMGMWDNVKNYPQPIGLWNSHKYTEVWLAK